MCHCQLSLQPGTPPDRSKFPKRTTRKTVNSSEHFFQWLLSFLACSALQWHHMGIRQASLICTCAWEAEEEEREGGRTWEERNERQRLCSQSVQHLSPSWGCCDYLVEIATLSTQTKLTMANDPWTGIDSCRKCRQCSLHPEWIRYLHCIGPLPLLPDTHTHTLSPTVRFQCDLSRRFWYQARMLSAAGFCHTHNESVSERPSPLLLRLNGERWRHSKNVVITHRRYSRLCDCSVSKGQLHLVEQEQEGNGNLEKFKRLKKKKKKLRNVSGLFCRVFPWWECYSEWCEEKEAGESRGIWREILRPTARNIYSSISATMETYYKLYFLLFLQQD